MDGTRIHVAGREIGEGRPCFVVAELSGNHGGSRERALRLVEEAAAAGCDAVKLQTYTADTMTIPSDQEWFVVGGKDNPEAWQGRTLYQLYQQAHTPWEWHEPLQRAATRAGVVFFSTPFDESAVEFLEGLNVPCHKIASYELTDTPLLRRVGRSGRPVILSTGFATREEVAAAVATLREAGVRELALLHCVTGYAAEPRLESMSLRTIRDLAVRFGVVSGFSDNNAGLEVPLMAVLAGACILEKHFTLDRSAGGPDARFSLEPAEMKLMVARIRAAERALGEARYGPADEAEGYNRRFRRSLFVVQDVAQGEPFTSRNLRCIRPAFGLAPAELDRVLGRRAARPIQAGTPLAWELVE